MNNKLQQYSIKSSYVQDEMGYNDNDIDNFFEGSLSAYWIID